MADPGACMAAISLFIPNRDIKLRANVLIGIAALMLTHHFNFLVHADGYTGNPAQPYCTAKMEMLGHIREIKRLLNERAVTASTHYPPGKLSEHPLKAFLKPELLKNRRGYVRSFWHSWFTSIYSPVYEPVELWYPGGKLSEAVERIGPSEP